MHQFFLRFLDCNKLIAPYFGVVVHRENALHYVRHRTVQFLKSTKQRFKAKLQFSRKERCQNIVLGLKPTSNPKANPLKSARKSHCTYTTIHSPNTFYEKKSFLTLDTPIFIDPNIVCALLRVKSQFTTSTFTTRKSGRP